MDALLSYIPIFAAMLLLMSLSAFFSCSEAAFFSLSRADRQSLVGGGRVARTAARLLHRPEQLLNSILLGNLIVNLLTFTLSSAVAFQLQGTGRTDLAGIVVLAALFGVILFGEIIPKSFGVLAPRRFVLLCALPLSMIVRVLRSFLPILTTVNILSRRLFCPNFKSEANLRVGDLERAVELSRDDATLLKREQRVLQNIVSLSDIRAEELMRPRSLIKSFQPPITFDEIIDSLHGKLPRSGYCLLTEPDSGEIASILSLTRLTPQTVENWERRFEPIVYIPWSASAAEAFDRLQRENSDVAAVVNEFGETVGILTLDDMIETIFTREQGRSRRLLDRMELKRIGPKLWLVNELTSLRRLRRKFGMSFTGYSSMTVGGLLREMLERFPQKGDLCRLGDFEFQVVESSEDEGLVIHLAGTGASKSPGE